MAKIVLIVAAIVEFVFRGLPAFFASEPIAQLFGLEYIPGALVYIHPFGGLMLVFGVMFLVASKNPARQRLVFDMEFCGTHWVYGPTWSCWSGLVRWPLSGGFTWASMSCS